MKKIISARRQNGQIVFYKGYVIINEITESQALAFDFEEYFDYPLSHRRAEMKMADLKKQFAGLSDWKIEDVKE